MILSSFDLDYYAGLIDSGVGIRVSKSGPHRDGRQRFKGFLEMKRVESRLPELGPFISLGAILTGPYSVESKLTDRLRRVYHATLSGQVAIPLLEEDLKDRLILKRGAAYLFLKWGDDTDYDSRFEIHSSINAYKARNIAALILPETLFLTPQYLAGCYDNSGMITTNGNWNEANILFRHERLAQQAMEQHGGVIARTKSGTFDPEGGRVPYFRWYVQQSNARIFRDAILPYLKLPQKISQLQETSF